MSKELDAAIAMAKEVQALVALIQRIQDALGTEETGEALVEVASNAHRAEMELASLTGYGLIKPLKDDGGAAFDVMATIDADYSDTFKD